MKHLSTKILLSLLSLVVFTAGLLWLYQVVFLETHLTNRQLAAIQDEAVFIYDQYPAHDENWLHDQLDEWAHRSQVSIERVDPTGRTLYLSDSMWQGGPRSMGRSNPRMMALEAAAEMEVKVFEVAHPRFQAQYLMVGIPVIGSDSQLAEVLLVSMPVESVEATVAMLKEQLITVTLVLAAISLGIGWILTKTVVRPIRWLTEAAEQIADGKLETRVEVVSRDELGQMTEAFNEMAEKLSQVEKLRREFIANVSHELRTPLSLIQGYAETIRDLSGENPKKRRNHADIIIDESRRLEGLVNDMLQLSRMQSGDHTMEMERVDLVEICCKTVDSFLDQGNKKGIKLDVDATALDSIFVLADARKISQVVINLMANALVHTPAGGRVILSVEQFNGEVEVGVTDTGKGIPENEMDRIWERFYRSDPSGSGNLEKGTGLGLAIVKNILEVHGARFGAQNQPTGGARFWFRLPVDQEQFS